MKTKLKKSAIICDNYKVVKFRFELEKDGFEVVSATPFKNVQNTELIVLFDPKELQQLKRTIQKVHTYFNAKMN